MADAYPGRTSAVSRLLADVRLRLLELSRWKTCAAPVGRNESEIRDRQTERVRDDRSESDLYSVRCCMGGRDRGNGNSVSTDGGQTCDGPGSLDSFRGGIS